MEFLKKALATQLSEPFMYKLDFQEFTAGCVPADVYKRQQFDVSDNRSLDEVVNWLMRLGYIPSFCTACYREGRTGDRFKMCIRDRSSVLCLFVYDIIAVKLILIFLAVKIYNSKRL